MALINAGGSLQLQINGTPYSVRGNFKLQPLAFQNDAGRNMDGSIYFTSKPVESTMECDLSDAGNLPLKAFQSLTGATLYAALSNGKTYVMTDAVFIGTPDLDVSQGQFTVKFAGNIEEVVG